MEQNWPQGFSIAIIRESLGPSGQGGAGGALGGSCGGRFRDPTAPASGECSLVCRPQGVHGDLLVGASPKLRHQEDQLAQRQVAVYLAGAQVLLGETSAGPATSTPFQGPAAKVLVATAVATAWRPGTPQMGARGGCVLSETLPSVREALLASSLWDAFCVHEAPHTAWRARQASRGFSALTVSLSSHRQATGPVVWE